MFKDVDDVLIESAMKYMCKFNYIKGKKIMFEGEKDGKRIVVCSPSTKIHPRGNGWFDLTTKQTEILDKADIASVIVRMEDGRIHSIDYKALRNLLNNNNMKTNTNEGDHWKLFVWQNHLEIQGSNETLAL